MTDADRPATARTLSRRQLRRLRLWGTIRTVVAFSVVLVLYCTLPIHSLGRTEAAIRIVLSGLLIVVVVVWEVRSVAHSRTPVLRAVEALAVSVSIILFAFAHAYLTMSHYDPAMFTEHLNRTGALYFTMTTAATIGYGDISAIDDTARIIVMIQMVVDVAVIGAVVRLVLSRARVPASTFTPTQLD